MSNICCIHRVVLNGQVLQSFWSQVTQQLDINWSKVSLISVSDIKNVGSGKFAQIAFLDLCSQSSYEELSGYQSVAQPGGTVVVWELPGADIKEISKKLLLSGFVDINVIESEGGLMLQCKTPNYSRGASVSLNSGSAVANNTKWTINLIPDEDDELIDDEELLTEDDKKMPIAPPKESGCGSSRSACANCVCGRAEGKEPAALTKSMVDNPQSGCGSCGLGDAFRCAGCPYRGLPKFEMGKKIELPPGFLVADD